MRLLHVIRTVDPSTGGPATVVRGLADAQTKQGDDVQVLVDDPAFRYEGPGLTPVVQLEGGASGLTALLDRFAPQAMILHGVWCAHVRRSARIACLRHLPFVIAPHGALGQWSLKQSALKKQVALALVYRDRK